MRNGKYGKETWRRGRNKVDDTAVSYVGSRVRDRDCPSVFDDSDLRKKERKEGEIQDEKIIDKKK